MKNVALAALVLSTVTAVFAQSNTFPSSGYVGIGTTSPESTLHVNGSSRFENYLIVKGTTGHSRIVFESTEPGGKQYEWYNDVHGAGSFGIYNRSENLYPFVVAANGNVGIGTTSPSHKLTVNGTIRAKEVIVDTGWADYVFADDYRLAPLSEVEAHIKEHKHLPDMPSAARVAEKGVGMSEMQARLLAKVEELTLHVIEQNKRIERLEKENAILRTR